MVAMDKFNEHLSAKGIVFACSMYNIQHTVTPVNGKLQVKLECERPDVEIRYTMMVRSRQTGLCYIRARWW